MRTPERPAASGTQGGYFALVIGIDRYPNLHPLETAVADAKSLAELLTARYGFKTKSLLDAEATRSNVLDALGGYRRTLKPEDNLLIYYAGHGYLDKDANKAYWLPYDAKLDSSTNWILSDELTTDIKVLPARHVLIVSDSCYAGALTRDAGVEIRPADQARYIEQNLASPSRTLMASGGAEPVADGGGSGHSVFAAALLRGLAGMGEERFTAGDLFQQYIRQRVGGSSDQLPQYEFIHNSGHEDGDFVFVRAGAAIPAAAAADTDAGARAVSRGGGAPRSIEVHNDSFEDGTLTLNAGAGPYSNVLQGSKVPLGGTLPDWKALGTTVNAAAGAYTPASNFPMGRWWAGNAFGYIYVFGPGAVSLSQLLPQTLQSNTTYTVTATVAVVPGFQHFNYLLQLWAGSTMVASASAYRGAANFVSGVDSATFTSGPNHPLTGQPLTVMIVCDGAAAGNSGVFVDKVAVTQSPTVK